MRNTRKWSLLIGLFLAFALVVAACGDDDAATTTAAAVAPTTTAAAAPAATTAPPTTAAPEPEETIQIAFFMAAFANSYLAAQLEGAMEAATGLNVEITAFDGEFTPGVQVAQLEDAIASGRFDAFLMTPNDGNVMIPGIVEAAAEGIHTVCLLIPCGADFASYEPQSEGQVGYVASGTYWQNGLLLGEQIVLACGDIDPCKVGYMPGLIFFPFEVARLGGVNTYLSLYPAVTLVASVDGGYTADGGLPAAQDVLQAHPDLNVFATSGDQMAIGIELALNDAGIEGVAIIGNGGTATAIQAIAEGRWFSTPIFFPVTEGRLGIEILVADIRGEAYDGFINTHDLYPESGGLATQDNAAGLTAEWDG